MVTLTLKNIPESLHAALRDRAKNNHRSINREAIDCLERTVLGKPMDVASFLDRVRQHRDATPGRLTDDVLAQARRTRRP